MYSFFSSCELAKHHRTGGLATVCANDPLWYSSILPSDRSKDDRSSLDWQLVYVSLNSNDMEQKDYKVHSFF
ncbi:hypothetical protein KSF78_0000593 [Schistosoma japonicum]|nr:hypothetical protein KSF78_0000593 [Schistosoma japonicum]